MQPVWEWINDYATRWHDTWEVLGALGSAAAAGIALWLATRERADRKAAERDRDKAQEAQLAAESRAAQHEREAQARKVGVWLNRYGVTPHPLKYYVGFANYSDMPITDCVLIVDRQDGTRHAVASGFYVEPGARLPSPVDMEQEVADEQPSTTAIYIEFTDAWNRRWRRTVSGSLTEITGERLPAEGTVRPGSLHEVLRSPGG